MRSKNSGSIKERINFNGIYMKQLEDEVALITGEDTAAGISAGSCKPYKAAKGAIHLYRGQEAVATGVCCALHDDDYVFSTHRSAISETISGEMARDENVFVIGEEVDL